MILIGLTFWQAMIGLCDLSWCMLGLILA